LSHAVLEFLFSQGIGVAFLTKGEIPDETLELLIDHADLVQAQIGLITLNEELSRIFEPHAASPRTRLWQLHSLIAGGVAAAARLDPILPTLTDEPEALDRQFAALAQVGVKRAAAGVLFLRPGISYWLSRRVPTEMLAPMFAAYREEEQAVMRGAEYPIHNLPSERRRETFARLQEAAEAHGIRLDICACKNSDIARGSCNIAGTWPARAPRAAQPPLPLWDNRVCPAHMRNQVPGCRGMPVTSHAPHHLVEALNVLLTPDGVLKRPPAGSGLPGMLCWVPLGAIRNRAGENRIDEVSDFFIPRHHILIQANLSRHLPVGGTPGGRRGRKRGRQRMGAPGREDGLERSTHTASLKLEERRHHHQVDKVLDARARVAAGVAPCVGMNLLGDMLLQGQRRDLRGRDIGEPQQVWATHQLWIGNQSIPEANVNCHILEPASREFCDNVVPYGDTFQQRVELLRPLDGEREVVAEVERLRRDKIDRCRLFVVLAAEIDILRGTEPGSYTKEKSRCTLNDPALRSCDHQARH